MGNRDPSGGVKIETKTFFRYFIEDIYYIWREKNTSRAADVKI